MATGARVLALVSIVFALLLVATSSMVLKEYTEIRRSIAFKILAGVASTADSLMSSFGVTDKIMLEAKIKILLTCSGIGVAVGCLQLLSSLLLFIGTGGNSRASNAIFSFVNTMGFFAIVGSLIAMSCQKVINFGELNRLDEKVRYWIWAMIGEAVFLPCGSCAACWLSHYFSENKMRTTGGYTINSSIYYQKN